MDSRENIIQMVKRTKLGQLDQRLQRLDTNGRNLLIQAVENNELTERQKQEVLRRIRNLAEEAKGDINNWTDRAITTAYVDGLRQTDKTIRAIPEADIDLGYKGKLTANILNDNVSLRPHLDAVTLLTDSTKLDIGNAMTGYVNGAERKLNDLMREQMQMRMGAGRMEGASPAEIAKRMADDLRAKGMTALIDRGGREWSIGDYTKMVARTNLLKANGQATLNRGTEYGIDIVEISTHSGACQICQPYEGKLYSISGESSRYSKLEFGLPIHPNCRHTFLLRPDLSDNIVKQSKATTPTERIEPVVKEPSILDASVANKLPDTSKGINYANGKVNLFGYNAPLNEMERRTLDEYKVKVLYKGSTTASGRASARQPKGYLLPIRSTNGGSELVVTPLGARRQLADVANTFYHELGHAIDMLNGDKRLSALIPTEQRLALISDRAHRGVAPTVAKYNLTPAQAETLKLGGRISMSETTFLQMPKKAVRYWARSEEVFADSYAFYKTNPSKLKSLSQAMFDFIDNLQ